MANDLDIDALLAGPPKSGEITVTDSNGIQMSSSPAHDGAALFDTSLALFNPGSFSADGEILPEKDILDSRVRSMVRNDAYVQGGARLHQDNIVGSQYLLNLKPETKVLFGKEDETWETEYQEEIEAKFHLWAESSFNWVDASRMNTFTGLTRLAVGVFCSGGEVLSSAEWMPNDGRPFRTAVQMIDTDRLDTPYDRTGDSNIRGGVLKDRRGAPLGYFIRNGHPNDFFRADSYTTRYVPIRKPWGRLMMSHIIEQRRPDQTRGISDMVAALKELHITKRFRDIVLQNAVVNATYAASIESELPTEAVFARLGGQDISDPTKVEDALEGYMGAFMSNVAKFAKGSKGTMIDGVKIPHFLPGTKLRLQPAGQGGPLGTDFEQSLLRYLAATLGVSYEQLSKDYTSTNYSSARAAMVETWKGMLARKRFVADRFARHIFELWFEEGFNRGAFETLKRRNLPSFYEGLNREAYTACEWIGASRGQIDEKKETEAAILRLNAGLTTHEYEIARAFGQDWRKVFRQIKREMAVKVALGIPAGQAYQQAVGAQSDADDDAEDRRNEG